MSFGLNTVGSGTPLRFHFDRARYAPGDKVTFTIVAEPSLLDLSPDTVVVRILRLTEVVDTIRLPVKSGETRWQVSWTPPPRPAGYVVEAALEHAGEARAKAESAFDVATHWTKQPRYGFLTEYGPWDPEAESAAFEAMNRLHLNGLQFYDWLYRHEQPVPPTATFTDSMGRQLYVDTIEKKIALARQYHMAPMAYVAIYAASPAFYTRHRDWGLYDRSGNPIDFGDGYLFLMNPSRGSEWSKHLIAEFEKVLKHFDFAGVHIDQYGYPKLAYDAQGRTVVVASAFRSFLDDTKAALKEASPQRNTVTFNSVTNWPAALVAQSAYDFNYIEVWPPYTTYGDLETIIRGAYDSSAGKATVIAAYVDSPHEPTVRLLDAVIFAHGATHIELGEGNGMLVDPYFPKFQRVNRDLWQALTRYYDFIVGYKEWLYGPRLPLAAEKHILLDGEAAAPRPVPGRVHAVAYRAEDAQRTVVSLINLSSTDTVEWKATQPEPERIEGLEVTVMVDHEPRRVWTASPDGPSIVALPTPFTVTQSEGGFAVQLSVDVHYWTVICVE